MLPVSASPAARAEGAIASAAAMARTPGVPKSRIIGILSEIEGEAGGRFPPLKLRLLRGVATASPAPKRKATRRISLCRKTNCSSILRNGFVPKRLLAAWRGMLLPRLSVLSKELLDEK